MLGNFSSAFSLESDQRVTPMLHPTQVRKPVVSLVPVPMVDIIAARQLALFEPVENPMQVLVPVPFRFQPDAIAGHSPVAGPGQLDPDQLRRFAP
jgi:hypothetical protein